MHVVEGPIAGHISTFIVDILPMVCIGIAASSHMPGVRARQQNEDIASPAAL